MCLILRLTINERTTIKKRLECKNVFVITRTGVFKNINWVTDYGRHISDARCSMVLWTDFLCPC